MRGISRVTKQHIVTPIVFKDIQVRVRVGGRVNDIRESSRVAARLLRTKVIMSPDNKSFRFRDLDRGSLSRIERPAGGVRLPLSQAAALGVAKGTKKGTLLGQSSSC